MSEAITFITRAIVAQAIATLKAVVDEWEAAAVHQSASIVWNGQVRKAVSQEVQDAAAALFDLVATTSIERDAWDLVLAVDEFDDAFYEWVKKFQARPEHTEPAGSMAVWDAYRLMLAKVAPRKWPPMEPIPSLVSGAGGAKLTHKQVAKMYGWMDANGFPDEAKVQEELTEPGKHYKPAEFKSPARKRFEAQVAEAWERRKVNPSSERPLTTPRSVTPEGRITKRKERNLIPEQLDELLVQGINSKQIVKMTGLSLEKIKARAAEMRVSLDGNIVSEAMVQQRKLTTEQQEEQAEIDRKAELMRVAAINNYGELGNDLKGRVLSMHNDGLKAGDIAAALAHAFPTLQHQKVARIISDEAKKVKELAGAAG